MNLVNVVGGVYVTLEYQNRKQTIVRLKMRTLVYTTVGVGRHESLGEGLWLSMETWVASISWPLRIVLL